MALQLHDGWSEVATDSLLSELSKHQQISLEMSKTKEETRRGSPVDDDPQPTSSNPLYKKTKTKKQTKNLMITDPSPTSFTTK